MSSLAEIMLWLPLSYEGSGLRKMTLRLKGSLELGAYGLMPARVSHPLLSHVWGHRRGDVGLALERSDSMEIGKGYKSGLRPQLLVKH